MVILASIILCFCLFVNVLGVVGLYVCFWGVMVLLVFIFYYYLLLEGWRKRNLVVYLTETCLF